jgi:iron complex outermembrane recepter protein
MTMRKMGWKRALTGAAGLGALLLAAGPALAQTPAAPAQAGVETIIVTAQQRAEDLQDVPISVAALPEAQLDAIFSSGQDVLALATRVPGLYAESSNGRAAPRFYIRGLGNTDFDLAASQPVSIIMDDVVMENVALKSTPIFDLDQVEVYRGPQGTLFGRNTTAGIIRFTSKRPTEQLDYQAAASYGTYGSTTFDAGVGGAIIPGLLSARASVLVQTRDDWIDNTRTPGENNLGGYEEHAGRLQFLITPTDRLDILLTARGRDLEGTSAIFRANVITPGTNGLNANYDRDRVSFNQGGNNPQAYTGSGLSANVTYDLGGATVTSITAYESAEGFSRGDIDGGVAGIGPGFIPFDSDTQDSIDSLNQFTQELRIASPGGERWTWQAGAFYFDGDFQVTTVGPSGFPPPTTVQHENQSWAVFGQTSYDVTDRLTATGGVRFTRDEKDFFTAANGGARRQVEDEHVSWELAAMYDLTDDFSVFARVADGFRGPSIQGRDVAFFAPPSVAGSETILSAEAGWKSTLLSNTLRLNGAVFAYEVEDIQLTAVGGAANTVQLLNAEKGKAWGLEVDAEYAPIENLVFTGGVSYTDTELDDDGLAVGVCAQCTILDPTVTLSGSRRALIDGNPFPNAPELIADVTARYSFPIGDGGELFAFTDWAYQGETNLFLYESVEFRTDEQFEGGLKLGYARTDGSLEIAAFARNITDEDNIKGGIDFNNNTAFVNDPRIIGVSLRVRN